VKQHDSNFDSALGTAFSILKSCYKIL